MKSVFIDNSGNSVYDLPTWINKSLCIELYRNMLLMRKFDEKAIYLQKIGKLRLYPSSLGQEAIGAAVSYTLSPEDILCPYYRDQGLVAHRGQKLRNTLLFWGGDERGNIVRPPYHDLPMIIPVASQCAIGAGIAYTIKFNNRNNVTLVSCGDGATSKGDFYESINFASIYSLPMIILINNNQWAISTNINKQTNCKHLSDKAKAFNIKGITVDGNDVFSVISAIMEAKNHALEKKGPTIIEAITYRLAPHTTSDNSILYRSETEVNDASVKEPLIRMKKFMLSKKFLTKDIEKEILQEVDQYIEEEINHFLNVSPQSKSSIKDYLRGPKTGTLNLDEFLNSIKKTSPINMVESLNIALDLLLKIDKNVVLMGEDVATTGGVFRVTHDLKNRYGSSRIIDFPLSEALLCGSSVGMSLEGLKPIVEIQFFGFCYPILDHLINHATRYRNRTRGQRCCPIIFRIPYGGNLQAPEHHSESMEAILAIIPGLKVVVPSSPQQAFSLLISSYYENDPVIILEHIKLYRHKKEIVNFHLNKPLDKALIVRPGTDISIITWGFQVSLAISIAEELADTVSIEVIDVCCLQPLDIDTIYKSLMKTQRGIILQESPAGLSISSEIISRTYERNIDLNNNFILKRISPPHAIVPYAKLESNYYVNKLDILKMIHELMNIKDAVV